MKFNFHLARRIFPEEEVSLVDFFRDDLNAHQDPELRIFTEQSGFRGDCHESRKIWDCDLTLSCLPA